MLSCIILSQVSLTVEWKNSHTSAKPDTGAGGCVAFFSPLQQVHTNDVWVQGNQKVTKIKKAYGVAKTLKTSKRVP